MATILSSPGMAGPSAVNPGSENGIKRTQAVSYNCYWNVPDKQSTPKGQPRAIHVEVAPGAKWAYGAITVSDTAQVTVEGAQSALLHCPMMEGYVRCWLDVATDESWMQLGRGDQFSADQKDLLIAAAEAILAAHD